MNVGPADGPVLSRWWDRVSPLRPRAMWVGTLDLVRIDASVRVLYPEPLDPLHRLLLRAIEATGPTTLDQLDKHLGLGRSGLYRWFDELRLAGMVQTNDHYALTAAGAAALSNGTHAQPISERRPFTFVLNPDGSAHYLPWMAAQGQEVPKLAAKADVSWLTVCIARPMTWKRRFGFPEDVTSLDLTTEATGVAAWKRLAVAHGERPSVALVLTEETPAHLFGFVTDTGDLDPAHPAFQLPAGWEEPFPELAAQSITGDARLRRVDQPG